MTGLLEKLGRLGLVPVVKIERAEDAVELGRALLAVFLSIAIIGAFTWLAIFEHNYHPRIYKHTYEPSSGVQAPPSKPGRLRPELSPKEVMMISSLTHARVLTLCAQCATIQLVTQLTGL